jgi:hypothetical protein
VKGGGKEQRRRGTHWETSTRSMRKTQHKRGESGDRRVAEKSGGGQVAIDEGDCNRKRHKEKNKRNRRMRR